MVSSFNPFAKKTGDRDVMVEPAAKACCASSSLPHAALQNHAIDTLDPQREIGLVTDGRLFMKNERVLWDPLGEPPAASKRATGKTIVLDKELSGSRLRTFFANPSKPNTTL